MRKHFNNVDEINVEMNKLHVELDDIKEALKTDMPFEEREKLYNRIDDIVIEALRLDSLTKKMIMKKFRL